MTIHCQTARCILIVEQNLISSMLDILLGNVPATKCRENQSLLSPSDENAAKIVYELCLNCVRQCFGLRAISTVVTK